MFPHPTAPCHPERSIAIGLTNRNAKSRELLLLSLARRRKLPDERAVLGGELEDQTMKPIKIDFVESYDRDSVIQELLRIVSSLGKPTLFRRDIDVHGRLSSSVVLKRFGSLRKALQQAGLTPVRFNKATDQELCSILIELWTQTLEKYGRSPCRRELKTLGFPISGDTFIRRFGSWKKALLAAADSVATGHEEPPQVSASPEMQEEPEARKTLSVRKRFLVFKRDRYRCRICGRSGVELEVDHITPIAQGGTDRLDNLQTLCFDCNRGKRQSLE